MVGATPFLLTPGPLITSDETKRAMLRDWGSRDGEFITLNRRVRDRLVALVGGTGTHVAVPMPGSGTVAVEAMLGTFVPREGKLLILMNGAYGHPLVRMCEYSGRAYTVYETAEETPPDPAEVDAHLRTDPALTHVAIIDCETTSGIINPVHEVARVVEQRGRRLLIDSMSGFGVLPLDARETPFDAVAASSAKCLEGVPGISFVIARRAALEKCAGNAPALTLDLYDQWQFMEAEGRWRFTPPTHVMAALASALDQLNREGGVEGRQARYRRNWRVLADGLHAMGFEMFLPDHLQAPILATVLQPADARFDYGRFVAGMRAKGYVISPGKLKARKSFRMACIGQLTPAVLSDALDAVHETIREMGVTSCAPARPPSGA